MFRGYNDYKPYLNVLNIRKAIVYSCLKKVEKPTCLAEASFVIVARAEHTVHARQFAFRIPPKKPA